MQYREYGRTILVDLWMNGWCGWRLLIGGGGCAGVRSILIVSAKRIAQQRRDSREGRDQDPSRREGGGLGRKGEGDQVETVSEWRAG